MVLIDTSVWVTSMHPSQVEMAKTMRMLIRKDVVRGHEFVHGELMIGKAGRTRTEVVDLYGDIVRLNTLSHDDVIAFMKRQKMANRGIGWVDTHLLASAYAASVKVWTMDKNFQAAADELDILFDPTKDAIS